MCLKIFREVETGMSRFYNFLMKTETEEKRPSVLYYFWQEWSILIVITITGIIYNVGMTAGPWFEGKLAQCLTDIFQGRATAQDMLALAGLYLLTILLVQFCRFLKRLEVRHFGNNINRRLKKKLYRVLVHKKKRDLEQEDIGTYMTKAVHDVDDCAEGIRKFTTEIFDTGIVMIAYMFMLLSYDYRLTLLVMIFPPVAYILAALLKKKVTTAEKEARKASDHLNRQTLDRIENAMTYRVSGTESFQRPAYEQVLQEYEHKNIVSGFLQTGTGPVYKAVSMLGVFVIFLFGGANVLGKGWISWNIASFTTFVSCYTKFAVKSSSCAKLFNAVQKAQVSWKRIAPLLVDIPKAEEGKNVLQKPLYVAIRSCGYTKEEPILKDIYLDALPGQIIGVTGEVASGKSSFAKIFLDEMYINGQVFYGEADYFSLYRDHSKKIVSYLGHDPELFSDTIENNILLGRNGNVMDVLKDVCMDKEVLEMENGITTQVGEDGKQFSGGQQERIALARALFDHAPLVVLDDPFSALDAKTEEMIFSALRKKYSDCIILLISHRLRMFKQVDKILYLEDGRGTVFTPEESAIRCPAYQKLYEMQNKGGDLDAETVRH